MLCVSSPFLHKMICGSFKEGMGIETLLPLEDVDASVYSEVLDLWCGKTGPKGLAGKSLEAVMVMASVADRLLMAEVGMVLEEAIFCQLDVGVCLDVLNCSVMLGLGRVEAAARRLTLDQFEEVIAAGTEGYILMGEEVLGSLLDNDELSASREEAVLEAVVGWMKGGGDELRGRGLLSKIRYGVLDSEYLALDAHELLPSEHADWIGGFLLEALRIRINIAGHQRGSIVERLLGEKAHHRRPLPGVQWGRYREGGNSGLRRLQGHRQDVVALVECEGRMCSGSKDGSIRVWGGTTLEHERTLRDEQNPQDGVESLAAWEGHLLCGHTSGVIRVWNLVTGARDRTLQGHTQPVKCLAVSGTRLASGSHDRSVKVWAMGGEAAWPCEQTLVFGGRDGVLDGQVNALVIWQSKVLSGLMNGTVQAWDMATGAHDATLTGHTQRVSALAVNVYRDRLFSFSYDDTIREWEMGTWSVLRIAKASSNYSDGPQSLVLMGSKLILKGRKLNAQKLQVFGVWSLKCECEVQTDKTLSCLAAGRGGTVWGGNGTEVVVWGLA
jgi:hypothetical protein